MVTTTAHEENDFRKHCDELLAYAVQLSEELKTVGQDIESFWPDTLRLVSEGAFAPGHPRRQEIYQRIFDANTTFTGQMLKLHDSLDQILAGFRAANLTGHIQQIRSHLSHVQPDRLADETLLAIAKRSWDAMEMAPYEWEIWTGTAAIPVFQASILFRDALGAYIKRPSFPKQLLEAATVVLKAAAKELIGKYNPIFGFAMVIAEVTTPHIERQIKQMEQTVDMLDRTFLLDDTLSRGLEFLKYVEAALSVSERGVAETQERFNRSFSWLDGLLQVARKAS